MKWYVSIDASGDVHPSNAMLMSCFDRFTTALSTEHSESTPAIPAHWDLSN